ncbi:hypothetical protein BAUCODRAFT_107940 [Baudoinia panamericana UAMH 10762]|uniref:Mitochondrial intermembrane space import and assembly protein 40 n=1 Tax=Baudoinia panamericana (strain UAMH 10762) TaxID=717646 RepID=M2LPN5_BAUPA|nr:uncharacterized protein BAUCODRAFT_107940 [Baudoinia panamericana UAMH 10762]EMC96367.1 hypothetical protein BAUCODRAFT_107940 [Baudoinia panamericana UAMH 10762]
MYRQPSRLARSFIASSAFRQASIVNKRFASTASRSNTWTLRGSALRWGLAGAVVYYYNTSSVFADEPAYATHAPPETLHEAETYPTIDTLAEQRRNQPKPPRPASRPSQPESASVAVPEPSGAIVGSPEGLEEEASQQGAFNEETGEINWDCPCLGGMATGPCGEQFKAAFSCFVYSKDEPKGVDCIEHFKTMQNCFRDHPDVYGAELEDEEAPSADAQASQSEPAKPQTTPETPAPSEPSPPPSLANMSSPHGGGEKVAVHTDAAPSSDSEIEGKRQRAEAATKQVAEDHGPLSESKQAVPKAWHDS